MELDIYGKVRNFAGRSLNECPFRFQGQYEDVETGLYYNRFRYYDPSIGSYISQDPIGLAGNNPTLYGFVKNPNLFVDIFGLECWSTARKKFWKAEAKAEAGTGVHNSSNLEIHTPWGHEAADEYRNVGSDLDRVIKDVSI